MHETATAPPTVSAILPTYNRAHLVGEAIQSVLFQTFRDLELLVIDDASTDNTGEIVGRFDDARLRYIRHDGNRGAAAARNTGIQASRGAYVAFQDSDDAWLPEKLERQVVAFAGATAETGVVYSQFWRVKGERKRLFPTHRDATKLEGDVHATLLEGNLVTTQAALVRRACFDKAGLFDERLGCLLDWELWIRISRHYRFKYIAEPLVVVRQTLDGISASPGALARAFERILEKHDAAFRGHGKARAQHVYAMGNLLCLSGELERGRRVLLSAARSRPLSRYWIAALISLLGEHVYTKAFELKSKVRPDWY